jgi:hypothetical protein
LENARIQVEDTFDETFDVENSYGYYNIRGDFDCDGGGVGQVFASFYLNTNQEWQLDGSFSVYSNSDYLQNWMLNDGDSMVFAMFSTKSVDYMYSDSNGENYNDDIYYGGSDVQVPQEFYGITKEIENLMYYEGTSTSDSCDDTLDVTTLTYDAEFGFDDDGEWFVRLTPSEGDVIEYNDENMREVTPYVYTDSATGYTSASVYGKVTLDTHTELSVNFFFDSSDTAGIYINQYNTGSDYNCFFGVWGDTYRYDTYNELNPAFVNKFKFMRDLTAAGATPSETCVDTYSLTTTDYSSFFGFDELGNWFIDLRNEQDVSVYRLTANDMDSESTYNYKDSYSNYASASVWGEKTIDETTKLSISFYMDTPDVTANPLEMNSTSLSLYQYKTNGDYNCYFNLTGNTYNNPNNYPSPGDGENDSSMNPPLDEFGYPIY